MPNFLVLTYTPKAPLLSDASLSTLRRLSKDLQKIPQIASVTSILNVPLLQSPPKPLKDLLEKIPTLSDKDTNKTLAKKEFLNSPIYKNNLVSSDFKTTAILLNLKDDTKYTDFIKKRDALRKKGDEEGLFKLNIQFKKYKNLKREIDHKNILQIRSIIKKYKKTPKYF